jgi:hypothetical protein
MALALEGEENEAKTVLGGVVGTAESTQNPHSFSNALLAQGLVNRYAEPATALSALRQL